MIKSLAFVIDLLLKQCNSILNNLLTKIYLQYLHFQLSGIALIKTLLKSPQVSTNHFIACFPLPSFSNIQFII